MKLINLALYFEQNNRIIQLYKHTKIYQNIPMSRFLPPTGTRGPVQQGRGAAGPGDVHQGSCQTPHQSSRASGRIGSRRVRYHSGHCLHNG